MSNPIDTDPMDDRALDEYLKGGSPVSQRYRELGADQVPPELDQRVLAQARAAVDRPVAKSRNWVRWSAPLALAASLVMVVAIVIESGVQEATVLTEQKPTQDVSGVRSDFARDKQEVSGVLRDRPAAAAAPSPTAEPEQKAAAGETSVVPIVPTDPYESANESPKFVTEVTTMAKRARQVEHDSPMAVMPFVPDEVAEPATDAVAASSEAVAGAATSPPPPTAVQQTTSMVPKKEQAPEMSYRRTSGDSSAELSEVVVTGTLRQAPASSNAGPRNTVPRSLSRNADEESERSEARVQADPERWLADIRDLRKQGKAAEADLEWERFVAAYPQYVVAPDDPARRKK